MQNKSLSKAVTYVIAFFVSSFVFSTISFAALAESSQQSLEQRIQHLEELNQTRNKVQADISYQLIEMQRELRALTGQVEDNTFKLKQIQDRQRDLYRDIESRLSGMASQSTSGKTVPQKRSKPVKTTASKNSNVANTTNGNARREFDSAFAFVRNKDYSAAITAFTGFLGKYPNSSYSANARYWMGQVYLVQSNLADAEAQFATLISDFPQSTKTAAAKLKLGDIFLKQEKWAEAKLRYTDVANNNTGTQQQLARKGLNKIKQAGH